MSYTKLEVKGDATMLCMECSKKIDVRKETTVYIVEGVLSCVKCLPSGFKKVPYKGTLSICDSDFVDPDYLEEDSDDEHDNCKPETNYVFGFERFESSNKKRKRIFK